MASRISSSSIHNSPSRSARSSRHGSRRTASCWPARRKPTQPAASDKSSSEKCARCSISDRNLPPGAPAMVKAIHFFKRKPGMDFDSFAAHWRTTHAAIVERVPGLRRYVQSLPLGSIYQGVEPGYDGVTEAWFDDLPAMRRGLDSSEGRAAHDR